MPVAALSIALSLVGSSWMSTAIVLWPLDRSFSLQEAVMLDELLLQFASDDNGGAFLVTARSALAPAVRALSAGPPNHAAMTALAQRIGVEKVICLEAQDKSLRATSSAGLKAEVDAEQVAADPKSAAVVLARALSGRSTEQREPPAPEERPAPDSASEQSSTEAIPSAPPHTRDTAVSFPPQTEAEVPAAARAPEAEATKSTKPEETRPEEFAVPAQQGPLEQAPTSPVSAPPSATTALAPKRRTESTEAGRRWYEMAVQSYREANYTMALDRLDRALREGAAQSDVLEMRAKILGALGDTAAQRRVLEQLVQIDPGRTRAVIALALLQEQQGLWQEAVRTLEQGLAATPTDPQLYSRLASLHRRQRQPMQALEILRRGLEATDDPNLALALAEAQDAMGDWRGALALYAKLANDADANVRARALESLGDSYSRRGMAEQAVEAYVEAAATRGQAAILGSARYRAVYGAVDALVAGHVSQAWQAFESVTAGDQTVTREAALEMLSTASERLGRALSLCDDALPPADLAKEHRQRQLYYSLLREALTAALTYVDTGRADMLTLARERMKDAAEEQAELTKQ